jgi:hypothetical protein
MTNRGPTFFFFLNLNLYSTAYTESTEAVTWVTYYVWELYGEGMGHTQLTKSVLEYRGVVVGLALIIVARW